MSLIWFARLSVVVAAMHLPAVLNAALPTSEEVPKHLSLIGQLLVAAPEMGDPRFYHTVILMVRHDRIVGLLELFEGLRPIGLGDAGPVQNQQWEVQSTAKRADPPECAGRGISTQ